MVELDSILEELTRRLDQIAAIQNAIQTLPIGRHKAGDLYNLLAEQTGLTNSAHNRRQFAECLKLAGWVKSVKHKSYWWCHVSSE